MERKIKNKYIAGILLSTAGFGSLVSLIILYLGYSITYMMASPEPDIMRYLRLLMVVALILFTIGVFMLITTSMPRLRLITILSSIIVATILLNVLAFYIWSMSLPKDTHPTIESKIINNSEIQWYKAFDIQGSEGDSIQQTDDRGYIICVTLPENRGFRLIKTSEDGDILWDQICTSGQHSWGKSIQQTDDGGYIICGTHYLTPDTGSAGWHVWLVKVDASGNKAWERSFGGDGWGRSIQLTKDNGYIVGAERTSRQVYLIKLDSDRNLVWDNVFIPQYRGNGTSVQQTIDGGYIICANANKTALSLIKIDAEGHEKWHKKYEIYDWAGSIQPTANGMYIVSCSQTILKVDSNGNEVWKKTLPEHEPCYFIEPTLDGNYISCGKTVTIEAIGLVHLMKFSDAGDQLWEKYFKYGSAFPIFTPASMKQTADGGFIISGLNGKQVVLLKIAPTQ